MTREGGGGRGLGRGFWLAGEWERLGESVRGGSCARDWCIGGGRGLLGESGELARGGMFVAGHVGGAIFFGYAVGPCFTTQSSTCGSAAAIDMWQLLISGVRGVAVVGKRKQGLLLARLALAAVIMRWGSFLQAETV